jgi:hypothetical protein
MLSSQLAPSPIPRQHLPSTQKGERVTGRKYMYISGAAGVGMEPKAENQENPSA